MSEPIAPEPDEKDWTWVLRQPCPECGFDPSQVDPKSLPKKIRRTVSSWTEVLERPDVRVRPGPQTWSPLEYACHVRDVLRLFTERTRLMLKRDNPTFANWDQDATALAERYWEQDPALVSAAIHVAGEAAAAAFAGVAEWHWQRPGRRSNGSQFTVATLGVYLLHDLRHHEWDVRST